MDIKQAIKLYQEGQREESQDLVKQLRESPEYYEIIAPYLTEATEPLLANRTEDIIPCFLKQYKLKLEVSAPEALDQIKRHSGQDTLSGEYNLKSDALELDSEVSELLGAFSLPIKVELEKEDLEFLKTTGASHVDIELQATASGLIVVEKKGVPAQSEGFITNIISKLQIFAFNVSTNRKAMVALTIGASVAVSLMGNNAAMAAASDVPQTLSNLDVDNLQNHLEKLTEVDNAIQLVENKFSKNQSGGSGSFHFQVEKCSVQGTYDKNGVDMLTTGSSKCRIIADTLASIVRKKITKQIP